MQQSSKRRQEYKDFRFRRRHDHFLRFRRLGAKPQEIIETAKELGFNLSIKDLTKKSGKKLKPAQHKSLFRQLRGLFQL